MCAAIIDRRRVPMNCDLRLQFRLRFCSSVFHYKTSPGSGGIGVKMGVEQSGSIQRIIEPTQTIELNGPLM